MRTLRCPECSRVASVPDWCNRPICVHDWDGYAPEIWDGKPDDGRPIEESPNEKYRTPGPDTWADMVPVDERRQSGDCRIERPRNAPDRED
jgi:hypothetical protein